MKNYIVIAVILVCVIMISCERSERMLPDLLAADSIMDDCPDSAYAILSKIKNADKLKDGDKALYFLLNTQAKWKTYQDVVHDDTLLDFSIDYFSNHGDMDRLAKSYYYKGVVCQEQNHDMEALRLLLQASEIIKQTRNLHYAILIYSYIGNLYSNGNMDDEAFLYNTIAYHYAVKDKDTLSIVNQLMNLNGYYLSKDKYIKMLSNAMYALRLMRKCPSVKKVAVSVYGDMALAYYHLKMYDKALQYNDSSMKYSKDSVDICITHSLYGSIFLEMGKYDLAERHLAECKKGKELQDSIVYAEGMYKIAIHRKDFANTVKYGSEYANLYINTYDNDKRYQFVRLQKEYDDAIKDRDLNQAKIDNMQLKLVVTNQLILLAVIVSLLTWLIRKHIRIRRERKLMMEELLERSDQIREYGAKETARLSDLQSQLEHAQHDSLQQQEDSHEKRISLVKLVKENERDLEVMMKISNLTKSRELTEGEWQSVRRLVDIVDPSLVGELEKMDDLSMYNKELIELSVLGIKPKGIGLIYNSDATSVSRMKNRIKHKIQEGGNDSLYTRIDNLF